MAYEIAFNAHHPIVCNYLIMQRGTTVQAYSNLHLAFMGSFDKSCNVHHMEEGGDLASRLPVVAQPVISTVWHCHATCRGEGKEERRRRWKKRRRRRRMRGRGREERRRRGEKRDRKEGGGGEGKGDREEEEEEEEGKEETKKKRREENEEGNENATELGSM